MYPRTRFHPFARRQPNPAPVDPRIQPGAPGWVPYRNPFGFDLELPKLDLPSFPAPSSPVIPPLAPVGPEAEPPMIPPLAPVGPGPGPGPAPGPGPGPAPPGPMSPMPMGGFGYYNQYPWPYAVAPAVAVAVGPSQLFVDLVADHDKARALVGQVRAGNRAAYPQLADALRRHSFAEEQTLYRTMLQVPALVALANNNWAEHKALDAALLEIDGMSMSDPLWSARFEEMVGLLNGHLLAEEGTPGSTGTPGSIFGMAAAAIPANQQAMLAKQYEVLMRRKPPQLVMNPRNPDAVCNPCIEENPGTGSYYGPGRRHRSVMQNLFRKPNPAQPKPKWWRRFMGVMGLPLRTADGWYPVVSFGSPSTGGKMPFVRLSSPIEGVLHLSRGTKPMRVRVVRRRQAGKRFEVQVAPTTSASVRTRNQLTAPVPTQGVDEWGRPIVLKRSAVARSTLPAAVLRANQTLAVATATRQPGTMYIQRADGTKQQIDPNSAQGVQLVAELRRRPASACKYFEGQGGDMVLCCKLQSGEWFCVGSTASSGY